MDEVNGFSCTCDTGYETPTPSGCSGKFWISIAEDIFFFPTGKRYILLYRITLKAGLKLYVELVIPIADLRKRSHYVLPGDDQADIIEAINSMFRYLDDLLNIEILISKEWSTKFIHLCLVSRSCLRTYLILCSRLVIVMCYDSPKFECMTKSYDMF